MDNLIIRNATQSDYSEIENLTRDAFWNIYKPGCDEHYLVHVIHKHEDYIPELDFVAILDGEIVGNIIYTKAHLTDESGNVKNILTFGPLSVLPKYQRKGIGKQLLNHSFEKAIQMGYDTIVIYGNPGNYVTSGFKSCKKYNICIGDNYFPTALLVKELSHFDIDGCRWNYVESKAIEMNPADVEEFDKSFPAKEKAYKESQEEFYIYTHSSVN